MNGLLLYLYIEGGRMKKHIMSKSAFLFVILFSSVGSTQTVRWIYQFDGQYHSHDFANSIAYGSDGYLYSAGSSKYTDWSDNFTVVSLDQNGAERWIYLYLTPGNTSDVAKSITCGSDGNVYAAGQSNCCGIFLDLLVISLDANGTERWKYRSDSTTYVWDDVSSIVYGPDGNLYIVGSCDVLGGVGDFAVLSLDANGNERWLYRRNGSASSIDWAESVVFGPDNRIYACGRSGEMASSDDFIVVCLDQNGIEQWVYTYNGPGNNVDRAHALICGNDGNIYIAGECESSNTDFLVISLDADGNERWIYRYNGIGNGCDGAYDIVDDGTIYATGTTWTGTQYADIIVVGLDQSGIEQWIYTYNGSSGRNYDYSDNIRSGQDGNLYIAGSSHFSNDLDNSECLAICIDTSGSEQWVYRYSGSEPLRDMFRSVTYGTGGDAFFAGLSHDSLTETNFTIVKINTQTMIKEYIVNRKTTNQYGPTILNGSLILPSNKKCRVIDISGRVVEPKGVSPGIYFIEIEGVISQKIIKIK